MIKHLLLVSLFFILGSSFLLPDEPLPYKPKVYIKKKEIVCPFGKIKSHIQFNQIDEQEIQPTERILQDKSNYLPMRFMADYTYLQATPDLTTIIKEDLMGVSFMYLSKFLSVYPMPSGWKVNPYSGKCYDKSIPTSHSTTGISNADFVIYVSTTDEPSENYLAYSTSCLFDSSTTRPKRTLAGLVNYNLAYLGKVTLGAEMVKQAEVTMHEIIHALGFSPDLFEYFPDPNVEIQAELRGSMRNLIVSPNVLRVGRAHYNCPTLQGIEFENQGGDGSYNAHWEREILHNEMMTASAIDDSALSYFTLALLDDTGWYKVTYDYAEPILWGKNQGCDFPLQGCSNPKFREFCTDTSKLGCTFDFKAIGHCSGETFVENCYYLMGYSNTKCNDISQASTNDEYTGSMWGPKSKCLSSTLIKTGYSLSGMDGFMCAQFQCSGSSIIWTFKNGKTATCTTTGQQISVTGYDGKITCPDINLFCSSTADDCPNYCSSRGVCNNGKCVCHPSYSGSDCSITGGSPTPIDTVTLSFSSTATVNIAFTITGSATNLITKVAILVNSAAYQTILVSSGTFSTTYTFTSSGSYTIQINGLDSSGKILDTKSQIVSVSPAVQETIQIQVLSTITVNTAQTITAVTSSGIKYIKTYLDGIVIKDYTTTTGNSAFSYTFTKTANSVLKVEGFDANKVLIQTASSNIQIIAQSSSSIVLQFANSFAVNTAAKLYGTATSDIYYVKIYMNTNLLADKIYVSSGAWTYSAKFASSGSLTIKVEGWSSSSTLLTSQSKTITITSASSSITITGPSTYTSNTAFTLTGTTSSDITKVNLYVGTITLQTGIAVSSGKFSYSSTMAVSTQSSTNWKVEGVNSLNNVVASSTQAVTLVPATASSITLTIPSSANVNTPISISGTCTSDIKSIKITSNGASIATLYPTTNQYSSTFSLTTAGSFLIKVDGYDSISATVLSSTTKTIIISQPSTTSSITVSTASSWTSGVSTLVSGTASSDISYISLSLKDGTSFGTLTISSGKYSVNLKLTTSESIATTLIVDGYNSANTKLATASQSVSIIYGGVAPVTGPVLTITTPASVASGSVCAIKVETKNLASIKLYIDNSLSSQKSVGGGSYTFTLQYTAYEKKTYTVKVEGLDSSNTIVKTASATWKVI